HVRCQLSLSEAKLRFALTGELLTTLAVQVEKHQLCESWKDCLKKPDDFEVDRSTADQSHTSFIFFVMQRHAREGGTGSSRLRANQRTFEDRFRPSCRHRVEDHDRRSAIQSQVQIASERRDPLDAASLKFVAEIRRQRDDAVAVAVRE